MNQGVQLNKLLRDSHTPQTLKVQILLVGLGGLCLLGGFLWPPLRWGLGISGLLFLLTTLPFTFKAWVKERLVAMISPGLLFVRALALGMGFAVRICKFRTTMVNAEEPLDELVDLDALDEPVFKMLRTIPAVIRGAGSY